MDRLQNMSVAPSAGADEPDRRHMDDLLHHAQAEGIRLAAFKLGYAFMTSAIVATAVGIAAHAPVRSLFYGIALTLASVGLLALLAWRLL